MSALVAYAVGPEGHRRLLAVTLGAEESQQSWSELLEQLPDRGLGGVELVIADEHAGLAAAVRRFLPEARRQRCTVHLQRNVSTSVPVAVLSTRTGLSCVPGSSASGSEGCMET